MTRCAAHLLWDDGEHFMIRSLWPPAIRHPIFPTKSRFDENMVLVGGGDSRASRDRIMNPGLSNMGSCMSHTRSYLAPTAASYPSREPPLITNDLPKHPNARRTRRSTRGDHREYQCGSISHDFAWIPPKSQRSRDSHQSRTIPRSGGGTDH